MSRRASIERCAGRLTGFGLADFGAYDDDEQEDVDEGFGVPLPQARLAAGALVYAIEILIDELFQDIQTLARHDKTLSDVDASLVLSGLPPRYAEQYTGLFAKRFLVTTVVLTTRLTAASRAPLACVAEELALHLLIEQAKATLELYDLADQDTDKALAAFKDAAFEDFDHEDLYDDEERDDEEQIDANLWFAPFGAPRYTHPYAHDPDRDPRWS